MVRRPYFRGDLLAVTAKCLGRQAKLDSPERKMWFAVLIQAIRDIGYPAQDARRAFLNGELNWLCEVVGLDPRWVIRMLRAAGAFQAKIPHTPLKIPTIAA